MQDNTFHNKYPFLYHKDDFKLYTTRLNPKKQKPNVVLLDYICGTGKSTFIIEEIKKSLSINPNLKFGIVVTLQTEIKRFLTELSDYGFIEPIIDNENDRKINSFKKIIYNGSSFITTHRLLDQYKPEFTKYLKKYILIIDEELKCTYNHSFKKSTLIRLNSGTKELTFADDGKVKFKLMDKLEGIDDSEDGEEELELRKSSEKEILYCNTDKNGNAYNFHSLLSKSLITSPIKTIIISYRIKYSYFYAWMRFHEIDYRYHYDNILQKREQDIISNLKKNIHIEYNNSLITRLVRESPSTKKLRKKLEDKNALCVSDIIDEKRLTKNNKLAIKRNIEYYVKKNKIDKNDCLISCPKDLYCFGKFIKSPKQKFNKYNGVTGFKPHGFKDENFMSFNCKATNDYANNHYLFLVYNIFPNPYTISFFAINGIQLNQDEYALSELIQVIFRLAIRNDERTTLVLYSKRMRNILSTWLKSY